MDRDLKQRECINMQRDSAAVQRTVMTVSDVIVLTKEIH